MMRNTRTVKPNWGKKKKKILSFVMLVFQSVVCLPFQSVTCLPLTSAVTFEINCCSSLFTGPLCQYPLPCFMLLLSCCDSSSLAPRGEPK